MPEACEEGTNKSKYTDMSYYDDKIVIKGLTEENAQALKESHESYGNPVTTGRVEIVTESDGSQTAIYERNEVKDYQRLHEDASLFGGRTDKLYQ